jgi:hypothetical protein
MKRRAFIAGLGGVAICPLAAMAQQRGVPVVGFLRGGTAAGGASFVAAFRKGLSETGFVERRNLAIEFRWGLDSRERQAEAAAEMVRRNVDVIVAPGFLVAALAAKALTATIPIVFTTSGDPVQLGLVASLSRPGGNVTGTNIASRHLLPAPRPYRSGCLAPYRSALPTLAAILRQIAEQGIHRFVLRGVDHRATIAADGDQPGHAQPVEMKGQRVGRQVECLGHLPGGHAFRTGLHQQPKHSETIVLGERGQSRHGICLFHASTITEISASVKRHFNDH